MKHVWLTLSAVLLCLTVFICCASGASPCMGDADDNGRVESADARLVLRAAVGLEYFSGERFALADLDYDGLLMPSDARLVLRLSVGLPVTLREAPGFGAQREYVVDLSSVYTYDAMREDLALLQSLMPSRFSYYSLGTTADGRDIYCAVVGSGHGARQVVTDAGIHGSEYLNPAAVMRAIEYYLRQYDSVVYSGKTVRQILADTDLYFIPMMNPDGIAISQFGLSGLRSKALADSVRQIYQRQVNTGQTYLDFSGYLQVWKANANGVDLNRNYLFENAGYVYDTGVYAPSFEDYPGNRNAPEAETAAYCGLINRLSHPVAVLSIHSQGDLIYWKCRQSRQGKNDAWQLTQLVSGLTGYSPDMDDSFVGASADWTMIEKGIPSVTVECGSGHNPLPLSQQQMIYQRLQNVFIAVAEMYG